MSRPGIGAQSTYGQLDCDSQGTVKLTVLRLPLQYTQRLGHTRDLLPLSGNAWWRSTNSRSTTEFPTRPCSRLNAPGQYCSNTFNSLHAQEQQGDCHLRPDPKYRQSQKP